MFLLLDILGAVGGAALVFSATLGLSAALGAGLGAGFGVTRAAPVAIPLPALPEGADRPLDQVLSAALQRAAPAAAADGVELMLATQPGLAPRISASILDEALDALLAAALHATPAGKVLVTGRRRGGTVVIAVTDDAARYDADERRATLRSTEQAVALQGGRLEIAGMAGEGTTVQLLLPVPVGVRPARVVQAEATPEPQPAPRNVSEAVG